MKKLFLILFVFSLTASNAQLEKGSKLAGVQLNLIVNDMYYTKLGFGSSGYEKYFGVSIAPVYGVAVQRNWIVGGQATLGIESWKFNAGGSSYTSDNLSTDLGLAPFTRLYLDITKAGRLKIFGTAAVEFNIASRRTSYPSSVSSGSSSSSKTTLTPSAGGGIAYFARKISIDVSMSNTALRLGVYKVIPYRKK
ncbi:MAG: hypothetical protein ABI581_05100 [Sediminibacterium sp.]